VDFRSLLAANEEDNYLMKTVVHYLQENFGLESFRRFILFRQISGKTSKDNSFVVHSRSYENTDKKVPQIL